MKRLHPIDFVESLLADRRDILEGQISVYRYHPQSLWDDRIVYNVPLTDLRTRYEEVARRLNEDQDVAFDSLVKMNDKTYKHLPLLDFLTPDLKRVEEASDQLVTEYQPSKAALVYSGRSYHLYMGILLSQSSWVRFMGRVLLLNRRDEPLTVDQRWIGHRLMGGYGSLRWSANVSPCLPEIIKQWCDAKLPTRDAVEAHSVEGTL